MIGKLAEKLLRVGVAGLAVWVWARGPLGQTLMSVCMCICRRQLKDSRCQKKTAWVSPEVPRPR